MNNVELKNLYNALIGNGYTAYDLGDYNTFSDKMQNEQSRKQLYDYVSSSHNIGSYEDYEKRLTQAPISPDVANSWQFKLGAKMAENLQNDSRTDATLASPDALSPLSPSSPSPQNTSADFSTLDQAPEDTQQWLDEQKKQRQNKLNSQSITDSNVIGEQKKQLQQKYNDILDAQPAPHPFNTQPFGSNLPKDATYYSQAIAMLDDAQHTLDTAHKIPNSNPIQNFGRGAARGLFNMNTLTLGLDELFTNTTLLGILDKADSKGIEALSDAEEALINAAIVKQVVDSSTDLGRSYLVGRGFTENLPYMIEFALSGIPAGALTKGAGKKITNVMAQLARKASEKTTSRFMRGAAQQGAKFATGISKGSLRAAAQLPLQSSTYNTLAERKIGQLDYTDDAQGNLTYVARNNEDTPEALAKTVASAFTTNLVETFGGNVIADLASLPIRSLANSKAWQSLSRSLRQNKVIQFAQAAGYQGAPAEFFEEMIDSSLNAIITGDQSIADVYAPDNIINTAGVTLLTSLFIGSAAGITTSRTRSRVNREYTQASNDIVSAGYTPTQIEQLTDIALGTPTQVSNWLAGINNEINTLIHQSSTDGSLDDSAQRAQRIRQLISQRDFVLASAQYQALIGGMRDNIQPAIDAATQAINAQAHQQSGYTIKVFINNKALNGYLHSGNLDVTTLPDGTPQVNLNAHIYQVAVPRDNGEIDIIQATPQDIVIQQAVPTETVLRQGLDAINQPLNDLIAQDLQQAVEQQQTPQTVGEGVNQDDTSSPSSPSPDAVPNDPNKPTDTSSLSDTDFDAHIDSLTPAEAISAIANRRGADDADQYANWKKAALTKQRDAAQKKLTREQKPFDPSRYPSFNEMKAAERQYNAQIEQEKQDLNAQLSTLNAQLADIEAYLIERNKQLAAEQEADNPLQGGIAQAVRKQPINTLEQYIAREIALGARLRLSDNTGNGLAAELGITPGSQEHRELLSILSNTEGFTPEQWAEYIIENIEPEYAHLINGRDTQDIRNAIIDTIHAGVTSRRRAYQFIADINQQQADAERQYYEQQLLASLSPDDIAALDAMSGDYWDEIQDILQYEQEAYNNYDTNSTRPTPQDNLTQRESETIQPSQATSNTTPIREHGPAHAEERPQSTAPAYPRSTRTDVVDNQGNPIDADGNLIVETVASIDEITDEDFETPTRSIALPTLPDNVSNAIGTNGRQIIIKKNVFEKNGSTHVELEPSDSREILQSALYNTNIVGTTQPIKRPDYKVAIRTGEKNAVVVLDVFQGKEYVEIIGWRKVNEKGLEKMQRQAEREGGQFLILSPRNGVAAALSALPSGTSSAHKDSERRENNKISSLNFSSEPNPILSKDTTSAPISNNFNEKIAQASADVNTNPTTAQKEAGNYKKGHVKIGSFDITIEQPKGSVRSGVDDDGKKWETEMKNTYGYIRGTEGVDGDHIDVFLSDDIDGWDGNKVFVVDQRNADGSFDEHKVMLGFNDINDAEAAYMSNYEEGWQGLGAITGVSIEDFEKWIASSHRKTKAFAEYKSVKTTTTEDAPYTIAPAQYTTKKGKVLDMHLVKFAGTLTKEQQRAAKELAKAEKGWYDREQGGFMMRSEESAKQLADIILNNDDAVSNAQPVSMTEIQSLNDGDTVFTEPQQPTTQNGPIWQYTVTVDTDGYTVLTRDDVSTGIPIGDAFFSPAADSPQEMLDILRNPLNGMQEVLDAVGVTLENKIKTHELDRKIKEERRREYEALRANGYNGYKIGDEVIYKGKKAKIHDLEEYGEHRPVLDTGLAPVMYEVAEWSDIQSDTSSKTIFSSAFKDLVSEDGKYNIRITKVDGAKRIVTADLNTANVAGEGLVLSFEEMTNILNSGIWQEKIASEPKNEGQFGLVSDERMAELNDRLRKKLGGQMNIGIDPEILSIGLEIAVGHIDRGIKSFTDFARVMIDDLGDTIRPYLKAFYNGARDLPEVIDNGLALDMTPYNDVQQFDVANFLRPGIDPIATAQTVARETEVAQQAETAKQRIKNTNKKKKSLPSQKQTGGLFDSLFGNETNNEDGLQRNDAIRSEGVSANGNRHEKGLSGGSETGSESEQQGSRRTELKGERTGDAVDRTVRPRLSDTVEDKGIEGKRKNDVENNRKLADELKGVTLFVPDTFGVEHELSGFTYYELENVFHFTDNIDGQRNATRKELDAILKIARKNNGKEEFSDPKNTRNNHSERGKDHAPTSVDARIEANIKAIELAKQLLESGEQATEKQMQTLRKFSGWGGLGKAFSEGTDYAPNNIAKRLRELLGEAAYQEAVMSANSAYYTPAYVVDTLWDIAQQMGFKGGNILEGSAGIGNILGQMPTHISERSDIHAIEIDGTSGGILSLLYPDAKVEIQGFEETRIANGSVDLAITNVPFVTGLRVNDTTGDKDLSKKFHNIHDFCIAKNVRKLREGGLGIFITSNGTLDNSKKLRDWIVNEGGADFVGAFRMHNKTFGGTGVTSDIIVIRKRVNGKKSANAIDVSTVSGDRVAEYDTGETRKVKGQIVPVVKQLSMDYNQYFVEHPENMAGEMHFAFEKGDTFRPTTKGLYPTQNKNQEQMLAEFVQSFTAEEFGEKATDEIEVIDAMQGKKIGEVFVSDGKLYINAIGAAQPLEVNANKVKGHTKVECFEAYSAIKEALAAVLEYQITHEDDKGLKPLLDKLNKAYDDFVATYGHFNKNTAIAFLRNDVDYANVFALEKFEEAADAKGNKVQKFGKTDVFSNRVIEKKAEPMPTNVKDGIVASIFKYGRIDVPYIAEHLNKSGEEVKQEIIESGYGFEDPATRQIEVSYLYLSGNVREKLRQAQENNDNGVYDRNIKALQEVIPMNIPAHLIDFSLGSSWIEPKLYEEYVKERTDVGVQFTAVGGTWFMDEPYFTNYEKNRAMGVTSEMLGRTVMGHTLIEAAIQNRSITVSTTKKNWDGSTETITDKEATQACAAKIDEIRQDFKDWARQKMQSDAEMSERMERIYNDTFNNYVPMSIPDDFVPEYFGGASHKFKMRPHQGRAIVRGTMQPLLLAHEVGTGKTFTLISTAMEMRRLGTARKPMIVVQNATVGQFVASAKELYPNAKILTLEEADRSAEGRKNFYAKIRYNDWDMIVVSQSTFEFIPDSEERQMTFVQEKIEEKMLILEQMKEADPNGKSMITRQAEREIALLEEELAVLSDETSKKRTANDAKKRAVALQNAEVKALEMLDRRIDDVENFDDMGIDALLVDEAHEYKHLGFATAMQRGVKGVDPSYSKKSQGVFLKTQAVLEKNNGRNVIFATGTPISNTAAEIWTFMRYLMPADTMKEYGIYYFDDFVRNFGNIQQMLEFTTSGKFKENNRFAGYVNLPELVRIWSGVSDTVLTKEAGGVSDKIPEMESGKAQDLYLPQTRALRSIMKFVKAQLTRYDNMSGKEKKENSHIPLTMYGIAKAAAVDARLVQSDAEDDTNSKTNEAVRQTLRSLQETAEYKGTVAIFADNYQNKESGFNLYEDIRAKLIAEGVPANEIVVMKSGMSVKKKLEIFEKVNRGEVRVILGSTFTLGTGVNIQERLHTLIHLDAPNRPMDYTQRNGRILRQGNLHKAMGKPVRILRFGVEDSLDVTAYQRLKTKGAIADSIMNGKQMITNSMTNRVLEEEEDVFSDAVAQLSGSEYAMLKNNAEKNVRKYASRKKQWEADQTYIHNAKPRVKAFIKDAEKRIEDNSRYLEAVRSSFPGGKFKEIVIGKHRFTTIDAMDDFFKEHNKSLLAAMKQMKEGEIAGEQKRQQTIQIGDFDFVVTTKLTRLTVRDGATLFNDVERKMTYSCAELGIEDIPVRQNLIRNAIEDITHNVITGRDFSERLEAAERSKKHNETELEQLLSREGKPFEYEAELEQAKAQYEEYAELMKKELEEKEAKYAEMDATVEAANDLTTAEEADQSSSDIPERIRDKFSFRELDDTTNSSSNSNWSPEEQSIIDQARDNGTYLLAPNGKPTNLTPRQWVQVRTKAFKQWFGDWQKDARIEKLRNSTPINIVFDNQYDLNRDSAKQWMKDNIRGEYTNKDTGETIQISKVGANKVTSHGEKDIAHLQSIVAIPQLIENAIYIDEQQNEKGNEKYDSYRYYVCGAKINGEDYTIKVVIGVKGDSKYYDHRLTQIEKGILIDNLNAMANHVAENQNASYSMGKDSKLLSILQTNASKIVDENGEPRVMYHGTDADITTFLMQDGSLGRGAYFTSNWDEAAEYAKSKQGVEDIEDLDENKVLEVFLNVRDESNITHSRFYREDIEVLATTPNQIKSATDNIGSFDNRSSDIRFRTSSPLDVAQQVVAQDMPRRIAKRAKQLADRLGVDITIINSNDELRQINDDYAYLADWLDGHIDGSTHRMAGMFANNDKRIFVFANVIRNLQDPLAEVEKTITHEVVAHYGLRRLLGDEGLANFLSDVWQSLPTDKQIRWGKYAMNIKRIQSLSPTELATLYSDKQLQQKAAEEYIANISEQGVTNPTLWQRICAAFRRIMRRLGFYNYTPTEADIHYILAQSYSNLRRDAETTRVDSTLTSQSTSTNSQEDDELINAAIERFRENFNATEIVKVDNIAHLRRIYGDITDNEFYNLFKEYKKVGAMYDADLNKIFIFAENTRNPYTELIHEATHAAIQKLYNSENLADKLDTFIKEIEKLQPEGCNMIAEIYLGDDYINEIVAYTLCGYIHNSSIEKLKEQLSPEAQQELLPILNEIGYEPGRKQHTKEYTHIFDTSRAGRNNSILPRTPRANQGNSSGVISQDARIPSQTRKQQTIADNTLSTLDDIAEQYKQHLDEQRQAFADAITPQPTDDPITTAQKVRFREVAEFVTRDNTAYEQFLDVANDISDAINENDERHGRKRTTFAEAHYDSMQRLKNLIDDIGTKQTNNPYITQNQARSRAQALTRIFNATHLPEIYDAVTHCIQALNPNIDWKNKDQVDKQYNRLSIYLQARTALERQAIKEEAARAEAEANGEEYIERDFAGLAGVQTAIFDLYDQYDETVKAVKRDREKLAALAQDRGVPTVQEFVDSIEKEVDNYARGNNQSPISSLWQAIQEVSKFQLETSYEAGIISRSGYQTLTYGVSIDNLLKQRYEEQRKAIIDHPGSYDNVTDYDKDGNATGTRKQLNSKAQQDLYNLANEYAEAVKQVPMPTNTLNSQPSAINFQSLIDTGWLTAVEVASFHRYYQYYTPLKGHAELTAEDVVEYEKKTPRNQSKVKSVQGHTQLAKDPLNQLILDTHGAIQSAEQNRWRRDLYNLLTRNPNNKQYAIQQRYYRVETNINGDKEFVPYGTIEHNEEGEEIFVPGVPTPEELANGTAVAFNNRNTEAKVDIPIRRSQHDEHTVTVLVDGEPYSIFFYDKRIADAVNGRNIKHPRQIWRALEKLQGINRLFAGLKTSLNPTFTLISNLPRDWAEMTSNNFIAHGAQHALTSFIYRLRATWMGDVQRAVMRYQSGELVTIDDAKTETERYVMEFITNGGQVNITQLPDYEDARVNLAKDLQYFARKGEMPKGNILARLFNDMAERVELAPRLATYIASRKIGLSISESINDAKEATVNFDRKGSWSGIMGLFQLFYNASAQSVRRQIQLAKKHPIRFTATYAVIGLTTTINNIMISWLLSSLLAGDDEDKKHSIEDIATKYFAVNPELRRHYNVIMLGDTYIRIPMAINYLPYVTLGDVLADTFLNPNSRKQHLKNSLDVTSAILDTFSPSMIAQPIGFAFDAITARDNREKESSIQAMTMSALNKIPVIEPLVQSFGNYNFMGGTLYDTPFNRNTTQPAYIEARAYTQPIWILASRTLNDITGGNEVRAGWANIPAESIENVMSIFGGFGEYGENIASLAQLTYEAATGSEVKASDWIKSSPLISRLYGGNANERYDKAMQSLFYDDMSALAKFNEYRKNADTPELMEDFNREYSPDEQRYFADLNTMQRIHNILKREERAKQNAAASPSAAQQIGGVVEDRGGSDIQALYELANTQFQSLASGHYQPVKDPYYKYMYLLDAIRNTPYTTQAGEVVNIGSLNKSERKQLLKNDKEMLDMLNLLDDVKEDFADIDKKYYPGMQLDDKQQRLYDQRLPRIVRRTKQLTEKFDQLTSNNRQ